MILYLAMIAVQVALVIDVIRHGRNQLWIMALIFLPVASTIAYLIIEVYPRLRYNRHVRQAREQIVDKLDPERELRAAQDALDVAQTAANRVRLADALSARGKYGEAIPLYRDAIGAVQADYRTGEKLARAQYQADRNDEALATLDAMKQPSAPSDIDRIGVLRARIFEDLARDKEAEAIYADVVERFPGDEVRCRYAALLLKQGRKGEARRILEEVEHRLKRMNRQQRGDNAPMYDWAMKELKGLSA